MTGSNQRVIRDYGAVIVAAAVVALCIRIFVLEAYRIPSPSMRPALEPGDTIFVYKWPYGLRSLIPPPLPKRGEIVVFSPGEGETRRDFIKRVVGLPGDLVAMTAGRLSINGKQVTGEAPHGDICAIERLPEGKTYPVCWDQPPIDDFGPEQVPAGSIFVVGDLRSQSPSDTRKSKSWGIFPVSALRGEALWVWLSLEPQANGISGSAFPRFRFERMFKKIE